MLLAVLLVLLPPRRADAQSGVPAVCNPASARERAVSVVASGGVSKGAYQAGAMWALLAFERAVRQRAADSAIQIRSFAGASAGNLNTLLGAIEWATPITPGRTETTSLLWHTWTGVGMAELLPTGIPTHVRPRSMLQPEAFDGAIDALAARTTAALLPCDMLIGNTMTRADAATPYPVRDVRAAQVLRHALVVHLITGPSGFTIQPLQRAGVQPSSGVIITPRVDTTGMVPIRTYIESVKASAAFPLAFPPRRLHYARVDAATSRVDTVGTFLDGAVFDNEPLSLGLDLLSVDRDSPAACTRAPAARRSASEGCRVAFISANPRRGQPTAALPARVAETSVTPRNVGDGTEAYRLLDYASLLVRVVGSAADYELFSLERRLQDRGAECAPDRAESLCFLVTSRFFPIFGEMAVSFGAFLGRPLRELDFYIGAYDGLSRVTYERSCAGSTQPAPAQARCQQAALARAIVDSDELPELSATGRTVLRALAQREHGAVIDTLTGASLTSPSDPRTSDLLALLAALERGAALADTLMLLRRAGDTTASAATRATLCPRAPALLGLLCSDGLLFTLQSYRPSSTPKQREMLATQGSPVDRAFYGDTVFERLRAQPAYEILRMLRRANDRVLRAESENGWDLGRIGLRTVDFLLGKSMQTEQVGVHPGSSAAFLPRTARRVTGADVRLALTPTTLTGGTAGAITLGWQPVALFLPRSRWGGRVLANAGPVLSVTRTDGALRPALGLRAESRSFQLRGLGGSTLVLQGDLCLESRCTRGTQLAELTLARRSIGVGMRWLPTPPDGARGKREAVLSVHDLPALLKLVFGH